MTVGLSPYLRLESLGVMVHWCAGCNAPHRVLVGSGDPGSLRHWWNGDHRRPSFTPGLRFEADGAVCAYVLEHGWQRFEADCTHRLAGQAAQLPSWPITSEAHPGGPVLGPP